MFEYQLFLSWPYILIFRASPRVNLKKRQGQTDSTLITTDIILVGLRKGVRCYPKFNFRGPVLL